eukprot:scaffold7905_cov506-Pinguiococcus_pyrenoidosus.AAC.1
MRRRELGPVQAEVTGRAHHRSGSGPIAVEAGRAHLAGVLPGEVLVRASCARCRRRVAARTEVTRRARIQGMIRRAQRAEEAGGTRDLDLVHRTRVGALVAGGTPAAGACVRLQQRLRVLAWIARDGRRGAVGAVVPSGADVVDRYARSVHA